MGTLQKAALFEARNSTLSSLTLLPFAAALFPPQAHHGFVKGVAWDPFNVYLATQVGCRVWGGVLRGVDRSVDERS